MILVTQGLRISTCCRYVKFTIKKYLNVYEDSSCLYIEFPKGFNSKDLIDKRIEVLNPSELHETDYQKIVNTKVNLNGLELMKLSQSDYSINQFIVKDIDKFYMNYDETHCEVLIPKLLDYRIDQYVCLFEKNPYLEVISSKDLKSLNNIYSLNISWRDINIKSENKFEFNTKADYKKYILEYIDIMKSFKDQLSTKLKSAGLELVRLPLDQYQHSHNRVTYRITDMDKQVSRRSGSYPLRYAVRKSTHFDFTLSTPNLLILNNFVTRYQNLDLISNFTEFYTNDKLGRNWISSIVWSPISTDFNQDFGTDEQQNRSFEAKFSADLDYYVVYDELFIRIKTAILDLISMDLNNSKVETTRLITS